MDNIVQKARESVQNNDKLNKLLAEVKQQIDKLGNDTHSQSAFVQQLQLIVRMVRAHFRGSYRAFSASTLLSLVFGLIYFITPIDLIPDFIPALGLTDDISLVYFILKGMTEDIKRFKDWENSQS